MIQILHCHTSPMLNSLLPIFAFLLSLIALYYSVTFSKRNIQLSIQQAIFKSISEKTKDCNNLWEKESQLEKQNENSPNFKVMSELIITIEIIEKSLDLFGKNSNSINKYRDDFYYLFWKQLRTDLRSWIRRTPQIATQYGDIYTKQVIDLHSKVQKYFEPV